MGTLSPLVQGTNLFDNANKICDYNNNETEMATVTLCNLMEKELSGVTVTDVVKDSYEGQPIYEIYEDITPPMSTAPPTMPLLPPLMCLKRLTFKGW